MKYESPKESSLLFCSAIIGEFGFRAYLPEPWLWEYVLKQVGQKSIKQTRYLSHF